MQIYHRRLFKFSSDLCIPVNVLHMNKDKGNFSALSLCHWGDCAFPHLINSYVWTGGGGVLRVQRGTLQRRACFHLQWTEVLPSCGLFVCLFFECSCECKYRFQSFSTSILSTFWTGSVFVLGAVLGIIWCLATFLGFYEMPVVPLPLAVTAKIPPDIVKHPLG